MSLIINNLFCICLSLSNCRWIVFICKIEILIFLCFFAILSSLNRGKKLILSTRFERFQTWLRFTHWGLDLDLRSLFMTAKLSWRHTDSTYKVLPKFLDSMCLQKELVAFFKFFWFYFILPLSSIDISGLKTAFNLLVRYITWEIIGSFQFVQVNCFRFITWHVFLKLYSISIVFEWF